MMKVAVFSHALSSCWNHGNAHFQRGLMRALRRRRIAAVAWEPAQSWSRAQLAAAHGEAGLAASMTAYPDLTAKRYANRADLEAALDGVDLALVHEWTEPWAVAAIADARRAGGRFTLLLHDTHHRAVTEPEAFDCWPLDAFDGVLAFCASLAAVWERRGFGRRAFVWHEAADLDTFKPPHAPGPRAGLVWVGNWGDGERAAELEALLLAPAKAADAPLDLYGVRYPPDALARIAAHGARPRGWIPNGAVPQVFATRRATIHVPRRPYVEALPGAPTIRVFEALACGLPLISTLWRDEECLFGPEDYLRADDAAGVERAIRAVREELGLAEALAVAGLARIRARHTCDHRVDELLAILGEIEAAPPPRRAAKPLPIEAAS